MEKIYGAQGPDNRLIRISRKKFEIIYGYGVEDGNGYNYRQRFDHIPTEEEARECIEGQINAHASEVILSGMTWNGAVVWLSMENQQNYSAAVLRGTVPVTVKLGNDQEETFSTMEELREFHCAVVDHIEQTQQAAWAAKCAVDYSVFLTPQDV